ncbi:LuxR C-terminal-related transcriptional regulator [Streptomyces longwoodensis]|uniref:LuxR C-terminal-related transcriptional regulator n=1 Tax=Streptomyces longwoodensis TaxID=68231 RepID=UPI0036AEE2E9
MSWWWGESATWWGESATWRAVRAVEPKDDNPDSHCGTHVDPLGDPFLRTRFALPTRPATFLRRARLLQHLDREPVTPLVMVNGTAGAGKTLLVADWAAQLPQPVAWLTLDPAIGGPGMFWAHVLQALRAGGVPVSPDAGTVVDGAGSGRSPLGRLAAQLGGREQPVTLVLDDYDHAAAEVSEQLAFVLHHAGPGLRLVLVTRTEPLLPLHRYRAAGEITEVRDAELAFTAEETAALLDLHGVQVTVQAADALVERTRGWAAGVRLSALAARESPDPSLYLKEFEAGHSAVADFLLSEVLNSRAPRTQDLLLRVSVLERFCADLANALVGGDDAESVLAALHRDNAFVEDLGHGWYRLHPLFREILRVHLRERCPGLEPDLHRRAARWLRRHGALPEMVAHGAAAGDWDATARALVDDLAIGELFSGLRSDDLAGLLADLDPGTGGAAPDLVRAARDLARHDLDRGLTHLRHAHEELPSGADAAAARLSCALLEALAARLSGSPRRAEQAARAAREVRPDVPAHLLDRHPELSAQLLTHLGSTRLWAGHFEAARAALTAVLAGPDGASTVLPRVESLGRLALIEYLEGWPGRAERYARAALSESERFGLHGPVGPDLARLVLAGVAVDRGELGRAQELLDPTPDTTAQDPVAAVGRSIVTARLLLARGRSRAAAETAGAPVPAVVTSPWAEGRATLVAAEAHLAEGRPDAAAQVLREVADDDPECAVGAARAHVAAGDPSAALRVLDGATAHRRLGPAVRVRAALARAHAAQVEGDRAAARHLLADALQDARRDRLRRPFAEALPWVEPLLAAPPLRHLAAGWLLPDAEAPARRAEPAPVLVERLSGRERDVLARLAELMSTEEIAADLYVSVNTVKTHVKSVYRKLAVNRRHDAVRRARELGLL